MSVLVSRNSNNHRSVWPLDWGALPTGWTEEMRFDSLDACERYLNQASGEVNEPSNPTEYLRPLPKDLPKTFVCPNRLEAPKHRLFCFPHAGSGASFYHIFTKAWKGSDTEIVLLQYPGREARISEKPAQTLEALLKDIATPQVQSLFSGKFSFFGHSMGALVAYELSHCLESLGWSQPQKLFLSGRIAPDLPGRELTVDVLSDADFLRIVGERYNAIPEALIENPELLQLVLPSLRSDFSLMQKYRYEERPLSKLPIVTINGQSDPWVAPEHVHHWQSQTRVKSRHEILPGDHFYLSERMKEIREIVDSEIA